MKATDFNPTPTLETDDILLRKMVEEDKETVFEAISDPLIWELHPSKDRHTREAFEPWFSDALKGNAFVIIDKKTEQIIGSSRYYEIDDELEHLSVGWTFLIRKYWGGETNRVIKTLMFDYAYQYVEDIWLHIGSDNIRSRKATEKLGAEFTHEALKYGIPYCWYLAPKTI